MKKLFLILTVLMLLFAMLVSCSCEDENISGTGQSTEHTHDWSSGKIIKSPTQEETGKMSYTCRGCGETREEAIPKLSHDHSYTEKWESNRMHHWHACTVKNCTVLNGKVAHSWDKGEVLIEADQNTTGKKLFTCTVCGYEKKEDYRVTSKVTEAEWQGAFQKTSFENVTVFVQIVREGGEEALIFEISNGYIKDNLGQTSENDNGFEFGSYKIAERLSVFEYGDLTYDEGTKAYLYDNGTTKASFQFTDGKLSVASINVENEKIKYQFSKYGETFFEVE